MPSNRKLKYRPQHPGSSNEDYKIYQRLKQDAWLNAFDRIETIEPWEIPKITKIPVLSNERNIPFY